MSKWTTHKCSICDREDTIPMLHLEGEVPEAIEKMNGLTHNKTICVSVCFLCINNFREVIQAMREAVTYEQKSSY